ARIAVQISARRFVSTSVIRQFAPGAGEGARTLDIQLGKLALYQLSYTRNAHSKEPQIGIEPMTARLRIECSTTELLWHDRGHDPKCAVRSTKTTLNAALLHHFMPSRGLEPRCLSAQAPQACVSTNFTTRAAVRTAPSHQYTTGPTGVEPATS